MYILTASLKATLCNCKATTRQVSITLLRMVPVGHTSFGSAGYMYVVHRTYVHGSAGWPDLLPHPVGNVLTEAKAVPSIMMHPSHVH